jgi:phage N-6-adenine-methyltransferase
MALSGFRAQAHPQQVSRRWPDDVDGVDDRATHPVHFADFNAEHGPFTLDVAAAAHNTKCEKYFTREQDGTAQDWSGERVWCNPPYSDIAPWVRKAWSSYADTLGVAMLLPANRTEQSWWQLLVEPYRDRPGSPLTVRFLPGRMRFLKPGQTAVGPNQRPPFGCVLLVWDADVDAITYSADRIPAGGLFTHGSEPA